MIDYGIHWGVSPFGFKYQKEGWYKTDSGIPADEEQKQLLRDSGWDLVDDLTYQGAECILQEIIENAI